MIFEILVAVLIGLSIGNLMIHYLLYKKRSKAPMSVQDNCTAINLLAHTVDEQLAEQRNTDTLNSAIEDTLERQIADICKRYADTNIDAVFWRITSHQIKKYFNRR